jgi:hypothetical protein
MKFLEFPRRFKGRKEETPEKTGKLQKTGRNSNAKA